LSVYLFVGISKSRVTLDPSGWTPFYLVLLTCVCHTETWCHSKRLTVWAVNFSKYFYFHLRAIPELLCVHLHKC